MHKLRTLLIASLLIFPLCSCDRKTKKENDKTSLADISPAMTPFFRFDSDTIQTGDSLTGVIGAIFKPSITSKQRHELIATISYRFDTTDIELTSEASFDKSKRLNDSTFRFSILPTHTGLNSIVKSSLFVSINVEYDSPDNKKQTYIFRNRFEFHIKK